jgi:hypothetical protein
VGVKDEGMKKYCKGCDQDKPLDAFNKDRTSPDGKRYLCKICSRKYYPKNQKNRKENRLVEKYQGGWLNGDDHLYV